jgi:hypothetical protein
MGPRPAPEPPAGSVPARVPWEFETAGRGGGDGERGQTTPDVARGVAQTEDGVYGWHSFEPEVVNTVDGGWQRRLVRRS